jgi:methylamine---corrinoid protein Co-methyltransferase
MNISFWEVVERAKTGRAVSEQDYDLEIFVPKLREVVETYHIQYDPSCPVPADDALPRKVFQAALEFYSEVGSYCTDTGRIIRFSREEIIEALHAAPSRVQFGEGRDMAVMAHRKIEDPIQPCLWLSAGSMPTNESLFGPILESFIQQPLAQIISMPLIKEVHGVHIGAGDPTEYLGATRSALMLNDARARAGRPGIACGNAVTNAVTAAGILAATRPNFGLRPSDGYFTPAISELKIDMDRLLRNAFMLDWNANIGFLFAPIFGGMCGGPAPLAVATVAYYMMGAVACRAHYYVSLPLHFNYSNNTHRFLLWAISTSIQAIAQNTHLVLVNHLYSRNGPATAKLAYECAAWALTLVPSGGNVAGIGFCGGGDKHASYCNPLDTRLLGEISRGAVALDRKEANDLLNRILPLYEHELDGGYDIGRPFPELFDVNRRVPYPETVLHYQKMKSELSAFGVSIPE